MVRFITKNGKHIPIDDNKPRTSSNGRNDESEGMSIGSGTRVPKTETELKSNITREIGDPSSETRLFDPLVETSPIVDGERVRSSLLIQVLNMFEITGDDRFEDEPYVAELLLVPMNQSLSKEKLKDIARTAGISTKEVDDADKIGFGASFRIGDELSGDDPIELVNLLEEDVPIASSNPEEFLGQQVNLIGDTIESKLKELIE